MARNISPMLSPTEYLMQTSKGLKIVKRRTRWTAERKAIFLKELEQSCNIRAAERAADMPESSAHRERRADPEFAAAWNAALDSGYLELEQRLMALALRQINPEGAADALEEDQKIDPALALRLLAAHQTKMAKAETKRPIRIITREAAEAEIWKQLQALHKRTQSGHDPKK
jgi:hypothetical protein